MNQGHSCVLAFYQSEYILIIFVVIVVLRLIGHACIQYLRLFYKSYKDLIQATTLDTHVSDFIKRMLQITQPTHKGYENH